MGVPGATVPAIISILKIFLNVVWIDLDWNTLWGNSCPGLHQDDLGLNYLTLRIQPESRCFRCSFPERPVFSSRSYRNQLPPLWSFLEMLLINHRYHQKLREMLDLQTRFRQNLCLSRDCHISSYCGYNNDGILSPHQFYQFFFGPYTRRGIYWERGGCITGVQTDNLT